MIPLSWLGVCKIQVPGRVCSNAAEMHIEASDVRIWKDCNDVVCSDLVDV